MNWIKSNDQLPKKFGMYICKVMIVEDGVTFMPVAYCQYDTIKKDWTNPSVGYKLGEVIEWLDESIPSDSGQDEMWKVILTDLHQWAIHTDPHYFGLPEINKHKMIKSLKSQYIITRKQ